MIRYAFAWACAVLGQTTAVGAEPGLVAHYAFDHQSGSVVKDLSGQGNDGKLVGRATTVKSPWGAGLELDGKGGYVDAGTAKSLNIAAGGTILLWCLPKTVQGGLVNWSTGGGWSDERLALAVNTYSGGPSPIVAMADGKQYGFMSLGKLARNAWNHVAVTFDGEAVRVYREGLLESSRAQWTRPEIAGVPLWIGRCQGLGKETFHGILSDVRIYNRPLSAREIAAHYLRDARLRGMDLTGFERVGVRATAYPAPGRIVAAVDCRAMSLARQLHGLRITLSQEGSAEPLQTVEEQLNETGSTEVVLDAQRLPVGRYTVMAKALDAARQPVGKPGTASIFWTGKPEAFQRVRILNNLCWELLEAKGEAVAAQEKTFRLPIDRWVFVRTVAEMPAGGEVRVELVGDPVGKPLAVHSSAGTIEAMRYLKAGNYVLKTARKGGASLGRITVRAIPALQHAFYHTTPHIGAYGVYDWQFLSKDVLPNVNVMISAGRPDPQHVREWRAGGRQWISIIGVPAVKADQPDAVEKAFRHWASSPGYQDPLMNGIIVDEFGGGDDPLYDVYRQAVQRLNAAFPGKAYLPYGGTFYGKDRSREFAKAALAGGGYLCREHYLPEQPTREAAQQLLTRVLAGEAAEWEAGLPGVTPRLIYVLGYMSQPNESLNINPAVNFRVYMDMQLRTLATHPALFGLGGIQEYHIAYCDEENARWAGRLYRHYCIEGNTTPAADDPYRLIHIENPDFADGLRGWTIQPAEQGSLTTGRHPGYSWLMGRYPPTHLGDTFLLARRSPKKPNVFRQPIKDLKPGRLYSMKMVTADYQDLVHDRSDKKSNAVSIALGGVEILPGATKSFQFTFPSCYAHILGKFNASHPYWMNYHWRVFRARGESAELTVTDWQDQQSPGGPIGQELMFNFVEIQPYLGE
jgi:hypothetical protein